MSAQRRWGTRCRSALVTAALLLVADVAWANCSVAAGVNASFGSVTSVVVTTTVQQTSTSNAGLTCTPTLLSILQTNDHFFATITSGSGGLLGPSGDVVPYGVYGDGTTTHPIAFGVPFDYATGNLILLLGLLGNQSASMPMHFRTTIGANVAAGTYTDTLSITWQWDYCRGIGAFGICVLGRDIGTASTTLQVTVVVTNTCSVSSAPDVNFGQAPTPDSFATVQQSLSVLCTKGLAAYTIGLSAGQHAAGGRRRMANGGQFLEYDIFKPATSALWGASGADRVSASAPANGITAQDYQYRADVYANQASPPVGAYADVVVIDVIF